MKKTVQAGIVRLFTQSTNVKVIDKTTRKYMQSAFNNTQLLEEKDYRTLIDLLDLLKQILPFMKAKVNLISRLKK